MVYSSVVALALAVAAQTGGANLARDEIMTASIRVSVRVEQGTGTAQFNATGSSLATALETSVSGDGFVSGQAETVAVSLRTLAVNLGCDVGPLEPGNVVGSEDFRFAVLCVGRHGSLNDTAAELSRAILAFAP